MRAIVLLTLLLSGLGCSPPEVPAPPVTKVEPRVTRFHPTIFEAKARGLIP